MMIFYFVGPVFSKETNPFKRIALYLIDKKGLLAKFIKIRHTDQHNTAMVYLTEI